MDRRLFFLINTAQKALYNYVNHKSEDLLGTSIVQVGALLYIGKNQGCYQNDLAKELGINHTAVISLLRRMESSKLLHRKKSPEDSRANQIFLCAKGKKKIPKILALIKELNELISEDFSKEEISIICKFLSKTRTKFLRIYQERT